MKEMGEKTKKTPEDIVKKMKLKVLDRDNGTSKKEDDDDIDIKDIPFK